MMDLLGGYKGERTDSGGMDHTEGEEQLYEPSPFFARRDGGVGVGAGAGAGAGATAAAATATRTHSRDSSTVDKSSSELNRLANTATNTTTTAAPTTNRNSNSTGYGIDWNPLTWEPVSSSNRQSGVFEGEDVQNTRGATPGHTNQVAGGGGGGAVLASNSPQLGSVSSEFSPVGAGLIRNASTRKPSLHQAPLTPTTPTLSNINHRQSEVFSGHEGGLQTTGLGPDAQGRPTRFVLHEDAGAIGDADGEERM